MARVGEQVRDRIAQTLFMDFSHLTSNTCDIDLVHAFGKHYIFGEIKNEKGTLSDGQRWFLENLCNSLNCESACLYITHNKTWQDGDTSVDVAEAQVASYYLNGSWHKPKHYTTVEDAINSLKDWWREVDV